MTKEEYRERTKKLAVEIIALVDEYDTDIASLADDVQDEIDEIFIKEAVVVE